MNRALFAIVLCVLTMQAMAQEGRWVNAATGKPLQPGIYGKIVARGAVEPPPVVYTQPVTVKKPLGAADTPVYLYVSPGQLRRWADHCDKWQACERPVYFVRVDESPSRLGEWKKVQRPQAQAFSLLEVLDRNAN